MNRRHFLTHSAGTGLFLGLGSSLPCFALASEAETQPWFFVQISITGGWDVTLATDPWLKQKPDEKEMFIEYDPTNLERVGNLTFGPAMLPMKPFATDMAIMNGIFMSGNDNGHDAAEKYMLSGSTNQQWGILPVEILENRSSELMGLLNNQGAFTGSRATILSQISSLQSLASGSTSGKGFESEENLRNWLSRLQGNLFTSREKIELLKKIVTELQQGGTQLTDSDYLAAAFGAELSRVAYFRISENLDSHASHPTQHMTGLTKAWDTVAKMLATFKKVQIGTTGQSLYDRTTFFITSEFARTAALNSSQGKDHNPMTNSVVLIGPSIKGDTVIGGSHLVTTRQSKMGQSYHVASPIDPTTGRALDSRQNAMILRPENVVASVVESLGISRRRFASVDPKVTSLTSLLKR